MRLFIKFKNTVKPFYSQNQLQGLAYALIKEAGFGRFHNLPQKSPRFFNFSQLFLTKEKKLILIVSSPFNALIDNLFSLFQTRKAVFLSKEKLEVFAVEKIKLNWSFPLYLKTETPIIIRVPQEKFPHYQINLKINYQNFFWRPLNNIPFEPFIKQLEAGIYKKYKLFSGDTSLQEKPVFFRFIYKKTVDLPYFKNGQKISRIGTLWEFEVSPAIDKKVAEFILDVGLGELNSQGYGFVNLARGKYFVT